MTAPSTTEPPADFPGRLLAVRLGAALLAALVLTLALVLWDNARRSTLEGIVETTAVGDTSYVVLPDPLPPKPFPPLAQLHGRPLVPSSYKRYDKHEAEMQAVARDEAAGLNVYQELGKKRDDADLPAYFLKAGPGEFLKVEPAKAAQ